MGTFVGFHAFTLPFVLLEAFDTFVPVFVARNRLFGSYTTVYFDAPGCTGSAYSDVAKWNDEPGILPTSIINKAATGYTLYVVDDSSGTVSVAVKSYFNDGTCNSANQTRQVYPVHPPVSLAFTAPFTFQQEP